MKVIAFNGSPRKGWNTHMLLDMALQGAKSKGAEVEMVNLYDLNYKGCISCFACKRKGKTVDTCVVKDDLLPILQRVCECDAIILGSPIYFADVTGEMRCFMERLLFPYCSYEGKPSLFKRKINTAFMYTMNVPKVYLTLGGYRNVFKKNKKVFGKVFGHCENLIATATYQFDDYSKYAMTLFDGEKRKKRRETVFKEDCKKAFALGERFATAEQPK